MDHLTDLYSDDEINIIEQFRNYGHPLIEGFVDGNYNGNSVQGTNTSVSAGALH
jgi:glucose/arabinose dehydrogenase